TYAYIFPSGRICGSLSCGRLSSASIVHTASSRLDKDFPNRFPVVQFDALAAGYVQAFWVDSELVQQGRVDVGDVVTVLDGVKTDLVRSAVNHTGLDSAAGHPNGKSERMMVTA